MKDPRYEGNVISSLEYSTESAGLTNNNKLPAYLVLGIGILALSLSAMFVRWANAPGPITAFYRVSLSLVILFPVFLQRAKREKADYSTHLVFPLLAGVFTACDLGLWTTSLEYTTASNATLLGNTSPLWVALGAWLLFHEKLTRRFWGGLILALMGAFLIMGTDFVLHPRFGIGDVMAIATGLFYGSYFLATQRSREKYSPLTHLWLTGFSASLALLIINIILGNPFLGYSKQSWIIFISTAIVSQLIGYLSLAYALGHLPARIVSPTMILQPVLTTILAVPLLGEIPGVWQALGGVIALLGIYVVNQSHNEAQPEIPNA